MDYSKLTDWQLVAMAKDSDVQAFNEVAGRYRPLIISIHSKTQALDLDFDDWFQEGMLVLWKIIGHFNIARERAFGSYLKRALINRRRDLIRRENALKRKADEPLLSLDSFGDGMSMTMMDALALPDDVAMVRENNIVVLRDLCSKRERALVVLTILGKNDEEIMALLHIDKNQLHNTRERVRQKFHR
ncbi:hypothetical protein AYR62_08325 [Secundilactobacillus paracollinoides]|uniref:RNA polymerase sigma-70 region 2 domain-containing protein n=1 Tax=Secundilactobacillus paracollinoides TaxID=240427 RepID=A0A1B2IZN0_9LACO|nr:sigma-70 family RNA polymerase sigma factor [Secundilactobacillus paracollinoides]ANZ61529.1 hypothetical protein AYR61_09295 [Secundilactobacillus paracollinoides]ANZ64081.1 hypothetical protein AYR62_08325 [Secundilactobacillus paracollinoides]ANZ67450.1 hypothetical protein AYR63_10045 [Secundilactobacillus paracollinoides]KRL78560.1 hypothetical protein FC17_GL000924 [Secundilactobacillus paracollinoides DSM 15502 = JCM 11969]